jgi:TolB-like protein/Tfp pilus assembly protein PilF
VARDSSTTAHTGKKLDRVIIGMLALALSYFVFDKLVLSESREAAIKEQARLEARTEALVISYGDKSIAVMPFLDMSAEQDQGYMADGVPEELLNLLAKIPDLRVTSRSSSFYYKGKDIRLDTIAEQLGVANILEGSVRTAGERLRISVRLVEPASGTQLWSENYDRTLEDIFAIQNEIAAAVVEELKISLLGEAPKIRETDPEIYAIYLQANYFRNALQLSEDRSLFEQVLAKDANYIPAMEGLVTVYINMWSSGLMPREEAVAEAQTILEKALTLDPACALCLSSLAFMEPDASKKIQLTERALQLDPGNARIVGNSAPILKKLGRPDEAIAALDFALARDPLNLAGHYNKADIYRSIGQWESCVESGLRVVQIAPSIPSIHFLVGWCLLLDGKVDEALDEALSETQEQMKSSLLAAVYHALNRPVDSRNALARAIDLDSRPDFIAMAEVYRGEIDEAFDWLNRLTAEMASEYLGNPATEPIWSPLYDDPRWEPWLASRGISKDQLSEYVFDFKLSRQ